MDELREIIENFGLKGWLTARVKRAGSGRWEDVFQIPVKNLITKSGLAQIALLLHSGTGFGYSAVGEGTDAADLDDTALVSEVGREAVSFSRETTTYANDTGKWVSTFTALAGGWAITEFCLVNASPAGGTIYNRAVFAFIPLAEDDQLEMTYRSQVQPIT